MSLFSSSNKTFYIVTLTCSLFYGKWIQMRRRINLLYFSEPILDIMFFLRCYCKTFYSKVWTTFPIILVMPNYCWWYWRIYKKQQQANVERGSYVKIIPVNYDILANESRSGTFHFCWQLYQRFSTHKTLFPC